MVGSGVALLALPTASMPRWPLLAPSPTPEPTASELNDAYFDRLLERYGVNPYDLPLWSLKGWYLFSFIVAVAITVLLLRAIYRGMQHPRLQLEYFENRPPSTTSRAVLRYAATPLIWIPLWYFAVLSVLVLAANRGESIRPADELVIAAAVVVGGSRLLAHINLEGSHELAKSVPLTLLSLILISGQTISLEAAFVAILLLAANLDSLVYYVVLLAFWDVLFTFAWLLLRRGRWRREHGPPSSKKPSWLRDLWGGLWESWGSDEFGPSESPSQSSGAADAGRDLRGDPSVQRMMLLPDLPKPAARPPGDSKERETPT